MRRTLAALAVAVAALAVPASPPAAGAPVPVVVIEGRGFGHGVGMAQEGALSMARSGATTEQIFAQFYPGTGYGRGSGPVRVPVLDAGRAPASVVLAFPEGGDVRESGGGAGAPGFPVQVAPGGQVRLAFDGGRYRVEGGTPAGTSAATASDGTQPSVRVAPSRLAGPTPRQVPPVSSSTTTTTTTAPPGEEPPPDETTTTTSRPPATTPTPSTTTSTTTTTRPEPTTTTAPPEEEPTRPGPGGDDPSQATAPVTARALVAAPAGEGTVAVVARGRRYRGVIEATAASGTLRLVNAVDVEQYLKGMGEVRDPSWPPAALRAQAVAARTYALRAMATGGEVCDTQRCQVYLGAQAEYGAMNRAVDDSRGRVLVFGRSLISAVYSANGGGHSASQEEGFGVVGGAVPYLRPAPYRTHDPLPWRVAVALQDVAARLGYAGTVDDVRVSRTGPSGRALEVTLVGSAGDRSVSGIAFDAALGLRSTLFTLRVEAGEAPPPPPPDEELEQAPPEAAAAVAAAEIATPETTTTTAAAAPPPEPRRATTVPEDGGARRRRQEALVVAAWLGTALLGAAVVAATGRPTPARRRG